MRRGCRIGDPRREPFWLARGDISHLETTPTSIVAVLQSGLDGRLQTKRNDRPARAREGEVSTQPYDRSLPHNALRALTAEASSASSSGNRAARVADEAPCASKSSRAVMAPRPAT